MKKGDKKVFEVTMYAQRLIGVLLLIISGLMFAVSEVEPGAFQLLFGGALTVVSTVMVVSKKQLLPDRIFIVRDVEEEEES